MIKLLVRIHVIHVVIRTETRKWTLFFFVFFVLCVYATLTRNRTRNVVTKLDRFSSIEGRMCDTENIRKREPALEKKLIYRKNLQKIRRRCTHWGFIYHSIGDGCTYSFRCVTDKHGFIKRYSFLSHKLVWSDVNIRLSPLHETRGVRTQADSRIFFQFVLATSYVRTHRLTRSVKILLEFVLAKITNENGQVTSDVVVPETERPGARELKASSVAGTNRKEFRFSNR